MASTDLLMKRLLEVSLSGATVRCMLLDTSSSYSYDPATDDYVSDLPTGAEPSDPSYSRQDVSGVSITEDNGDNEGVYDINDVTFPSVVTSNDIQTVVFYAQDGLGSAGTDDTTPGDDILIAVYDDTTGDGGGIADLPIATNGSDLDIVIDSEGLVNISTPT
jgi:hypothetical protein